MMSVGTCPRGGCQTQRKSRVGHRPACTPAGIVQGEAEHQHPSPHTPPRFHTCGPMRQHQAQPRGRHSTTTSKSRLPSAPHGWDPARPVECGAQMLLAPPFSAGEDYPPHGPTSPSPLSFLRKAAPGLHPLLPGPFRSQSAPGRPHSPSHPSRDNARIPPMGGATPGSPAPLALPWRPLRPWGIKG